MSSSISSNQQAAREVRPPAAPKVAWSVERSILAEPLEPYIRKRRKTSDTSEQESGQSLSDRRSVAAAADDDEDQQVTRLRINSRERKRMHDLNSALDSLREAIASAGGAGANRKLSKIGTLMLARNQILRLRAELDQVRRLLPPSADKQLQSPAHFCCPPPSSSSSSSASSPNFNYASPCLKLFGGPLFPCSCLLCITANIQRQLPAFQK